MRGRQSMRADDGTYAFPREHCPGRAAKQWPQFWQAAGLPPQPIRWLRYAEIGESHSWHTKAAIRYLGSSEERGWSWRFGSVIRRKGSRRLWAGDTCCVTAIQVSEGLGRWRKGESVRLEV